MEQILLAYGLPQKTITPIMMLHKNTKVVVHSSDRDTDSLQEDTLAPYLFIMSLDYIL